jgi:hypothetical protein
MRGLSKKLKEYKSNLPPLTAHQKQILIGLALGDLTIQKQTPQSDVRIKFEYTIHSSEYVHHLYNLFKDRILTPPYTKERIPDGPSWSGRPLRGSKSGNLSTTWRFQTIACAGSPGQAGLAERILN